MTPPKPRLSRWVARLLAAVPAIVLTACSTHPTGIVELTPDTYMLTLKNRSGAVERDPNFLKSQAVSQSMDFAAEKGKVAVPISMNAKSNGLLGDWNVVEYEFRVVDKNDPRAQRTTFDYNDKDQAEKQAALDAVENKTKPPELDKNSDTYAELVKLDDLRKKGILTQAEFESEKQKLLARSK